MFAKHMAAGLFLITLVGCATPVSYTTAPMIRYDKNTKYSVVDNANGFSVTINYSRYQFVPESDALFESCRSQLLAIAWEHASGLSRDIEPINEQTVRISLGRNGLSGITSCQANVSAKWVIAE